MVSNKTKKINILSWIGLVLAVIVALFELWSSCLILSYANELAIQTHNPFDGLIVIYYLLPIAIFPIFVIINFLCFKENDNVKRPIDASKAILRLASYLLSQILAIIPVIVLIATQSIPDSPLKLRLLAGSAIFLALVCLATPFLKINSKKIIPIIKKTLLIISIVEILLFIVFLVGL